MSDSSDFNSDYWDSTSDSTDFISDFTDFTDFTDSIPDSHLNKIQVNHSHFDPCQQTPLVFESGFTVDLEISQER